MSVLSWAAIIIASVLLYALYRKEKRKFKDVDKIPGPPTKFLLGNVTEFGSNTAEFFNACTRLIKKYGPIVRIWKGPFKVSIFLTDPNHVEHILSSNIHLKKSSGYLLFKSWIGTGLVLSEGEKWKKHKKILTTVFHFKVLKQSTSIFHNASQILIKKLKNECGHPVDVSEFTESYALDVIYESAFRVKLGAQENSSEEYSNAFKTASVILTRRMFSVLKRNDFLFRWFPEYKEQTKSLEYMHKFTMEMIRRRKCEMNENGDAVGDDGIIKKTAFLDILLESNELTDEEIRVEIDNLLMAGQDTVSSSISFGLFELAKHPKVQQSILQEIHDIVGRNIDTEITINSLQDMTYLDCVMKEILRLYPPGTFFERELESDIVLDGKNIPSGSTISFCSYMQHRNEKIFPNPEIFDPDRFLSHNVAKRHPFAYIPFSAGPRSCVGSKFGMMNVKSLIANVIRNFEMSSVVPKHVPILCIKPVLKSTNGLPIILHSRK